MSYESTSSQGYEAGRPPGDPGSPRGKSSLRERFATFVWPRLKPRLWQTWLNLQIWLPFLQNPNARARQIIYWGREHREGHAWRIGLPAVCWYCGRGEGLRSREYDVEVRSFEYALQIGAATAGFSLFFLLIAYWRGSWWFLLFALITALAGVGMLFLKSWHERVRLVMWSCPDHAAAMLRPDLVVDENQLHMVMPTETLAGAAQEELNAERRRLAAQKGAGGGSGSSGGTSWSTPPSRSAEAGPVPLANDAPPAYKPVYNTPNAPELPPIKLFGEDDEEEQK
ncbi:MAG: hypothetical protein KF708_10635 [Pirellulales bacterium]|nr:hypothetical protein [Pirellulales bacterium]